MNSPTRLRDAAVMILVDRRNHPWRVLMGKQNPQHPYMPGLYVFPGGKVEAADHYAPTQQSLQPDVITNAVKSLRPRSHPITPRRAQAFAMAAIRELYEETGYAYGIKSAIPQHSRHPGWLSYYRLGLAPNLDKLRLITRAATPPLRNRRYDARYFVADYDDGVAFSSQQSHADHELECVHWAPINTVRQLAIPKILSLVYNDIEAFLHTDLSQPKTIPYYHVKNGRPYRSLL